MSVSCKKRGSTQTGSWFFFNNFCTVGIFSYILLKRNIFHMLYYDRGYDFTSPKSVPILPTSSPMKLYTFLSDSLWIERNKEKRYTKGNYPNLTISINCRQDFFFFLVSVDLDNAQRKTNYFQVLNIKTGE